jgi:inhibitor of the pro-sigma K processing machinery
MTAWQVIGVLGCALVLIYLIGQFMREPGAALMGLLRGVIVGVVALLLINFVGGSLAGGFHIAINPVTVLTAGLLGLPGVASLVVIQLWLV